MKRLFWSLVIAVGVLVIAGTVIDHTGSSGAPATPSATCTGYHPVAGDTLWDLAESRLGNPFRWTEIWANNSQIHQPGRRYVDGIGRTIVLVYPTDCLVGIGTNQPVASPTHSRTFHFSLLMSPVELFHEFSGLMEFIAALQGLRYGIGD